jgi:methylated-DNA-[protein]-cysteine S-methyltransferase
MSAAVCYSFLESPIGRLLLAADETGLQEISFQASFQAKDGAAQPKAAWIENASALKEPARELRAYFAGELENFTVPLSPQGTPFQQRVWSELLTIPYGETISYGELARRIGNPNASRAVGLANGSNPIPIIIPCHRVIGANGKLTGYGGGLPIKEKLIALERRQLRLL